MDHNKEGTLSTKQGRNRTKDGLPKEAFAIAGDPNDPDTWKLPHHKRSIYRALKGRLDIEKTVDWERMPAAVAALSPGGYRGQRVEASPEQILQAAKHLADHYRRADKPLPDTLAALV
jgi:hypothetical protein